MPENDALSGLKDIYIPEEIMVSFWPITLGWWGLLVLFLTLIISYFAIKHYRLVSVRFYCLRQMSFLLKEYEINHDIRLYAEGVSTLLKRYAILKYGGENVGNLYGKEWQAFLIEKTNDKFADKEVLEIIVNAPYYKDIYKTIEISRFENLVKSFIRR